MNKLKHIENIIPLILNWILYHTEKPLKLPGNGIQVIIIQIYGNPDIQAKMKIHFGVCHLKNILKFIIMEQIPNML